MKRSSITEDKRIEVRFFQRRPRKGFSFSLEYIFNDIRKRLDKKINATVKICGQYNNSYFTKIYNIIEAGFRQSKGINHITGEVHFLNLLMRKNSVILTVHDCGVIHRKKGLGKWFVTLLYLVGPVWKSRFVTTVSNETRQEIIKYTRCNPRKIIVIPVAISHQYKPYPKEFNKLRPVILHIGTGYNKNLLRLIEALKDIPCHLTIIGKLEQNYIDALCANKVDYSNEYNISNERLIEKYIECDILSFISTFEGFGMPIVEANSVERVVITSAISSMPEVAGNAAHLVNPLSIEDIKKGMNTLIHDEIYRNNLIENGRKNRKRFDANDIAQLYYNLYKKMDEEK